MEIKDKTNDWHLWCRLCAEVNPQANVNLYLKNEQQLNGFECAIDGSGMELQERNCSLIASIEKYFLIKIKLDDVLPKMLCTECFNLVSSWERFSQRVAKVQKIYDEIQKSECECPNLDVYALRTEYGLGDTHNMHLLTKESISETNYYAGSSQTNVNELEHDIMNSDASSLTYDDPLEFPHVEVKVEEDVYSDKDNFEIEEPCSEKEESCEESKRVKHVSAKEPEAKKQSKLATNTQNSTFTCTECSRIFKRNRDLRYHHKCAHNKDHSKPVKKHSCTQCTRVFSTSSRLNMHKKFHLPVEQRKTFECHICKQKFTSKFIVESHIKTIHLNEPRRFMCEECGLSLSSKGALTHHMLIHTNTKPYTCKICNSGFKSGSNLKRHMEIHDEKQTCPECGMQLSSKTTLSRHLLVVHSNEMKHKCEQCGRAFKTIKTLKSHLIMHTGLKPYTCEFCYQTFTFGSSCRLHKKKLHAKELAEQEAAGAARPYTHNIPNLAALKAMTKVTISRNNLMASEQS